ncbi:MAG: tetratricopeptide repeat protein [Thauera sp.]|nr:tetratricopeptide repeat protein [Thauera sp.]
MTSSLSCPQCSSSSLRHSRWTSREEKLANPGMQVHRCQACGHRFVAASTASVPSRPEKAVAARPAVWLVALLLLGMMLGVALMLWPEADGGPEPLASQPGLPVPQSALLLAAREGDVDAQYRLGRAALLDPARSREEADEAVGWIRQAANAGHLGAMIQLGKLYRNGLGVAQNYSLAHKWIVQAALAGDAEGMLELGRLYRSGIGVEPDLIQAYVWFNRAAAAHNLEGAHERDNVALKLSVDELKRAQEASLGEEEGAEQGEPRFTSEPAPVPEPALPLSLAEPLSALSSADRTALAAP